MNVRVEASLNGIYPRSEALVAATRDHDRGRISDGELQQQYERDYARLIELQREAGLRPLSDGMLNWPDLFRPLSELVRGWEPGPLVRYFDNNTFYRQPRITDALRLDEAKLSGWLDRYFKTDLDPQGPWKATLPSPYFTARAARDEHYSDFNALLLAYTEEVVIPLARALAGRGITFLQLQEPWLAFYPARQGLEALEAALARLRRALPEGLQLGLYTYFGDASAHLPRLLECDLDAVGVDFVATDLEALAPFEGKGLIAGCLDARSSWLETPGQVVEFAERAAEALRPQTLYLTPNADLEFLPEAIARKKVHVLGEAARRLRAHARAQGGDRP